MHTWDAASTGATLAVAEGAQHAETQPSALACFLCGGVAPCLRCESDNATFFVPLCELFDDLRSSRWGAAAGAPTTEAELRSQMSRLMPTSTVNPHVPGSVLLGSEDIVDAKVALPSRVHYAARVAGHAGTGAAVPPRP